MNSYAILVEDKNVKKMGDRIILSLIKKGNTSKYRIFGKLLFLECQKKLKNSNIEGIEIFDSVICHSNRNDIYEQLKILIGNKKKAESFAIRVKRKGNHKYNSTSLARDIAAAVFEEWENITVDLDNPQLEIFVQIINNMSIIYQKYS